MANIKCELKNIRPRPIRGFLDKNKVISKDTMLELPIPYIIKAMYYSNVYVEGKLVETFDQAPKLTNKSEAPIDPDIPIIVALTIEEINNMVVDTFENRIIRDIEI